MRQTQTTTILQSLPAFTVSCIWMGMGRATLPSCVGFAGLWVISEQVRPPKTECRTKLPVSKSILLMCPSHQKTRQLEENVHGHKHVVLPHFCTSYVHSPWCCASHQGCAT